MPECDIVSLEPVTLAVTEAFTKQSEIPARIRGLFDIVYAWLRESGIAQTGHNYAIYDQFSAGGMRMRVGFPVARPFADTPQVHCIELAGGRAAHITHRGPYSELGKAHSQLNEWCTEHSLELARESWEIYGDWTDDESRLETDIFIRLA